MIGHIVAGAVLADLLAFAAVGTFLSCWYSGSSTSGTNSAGSAESEVQT